MCFGLVDLIESGIDSDEMLVVVVGFDVECIY